MIINFCDFILKRLKYPQNFCQGKGSKDLRRDSIGSDTSSMQEKKLQNQFSFLERATQTMNSSSRVQNFQMKSIMTAS